MAKLPKQLYVTHQDSQGTDAPLGFLNAYEPGKAAFEKKRITQEDWAYSGYNRYGINDRKIEEHNGEYWISGYMWEYDPTKAYNSPGYRIKKDIHEVMKNPPLIWNNDPLEGFKIVKSVSRYSTSNKLWRILDPRNVEFEISTGVLEQIIEDATIIKGGLIDAKCAWMTNKNLVVVL